MGRRLRPWWLALGVSLLLHGVLIGGVSWRLPHEELPAELMPFNARLVSVAVPDVIPPQPQPAVRSPAPKPPVRNVFRLTANLPETPDPSAAGPSESIIEPVSVEPAANSVPVAQQDPASVAQHEPHPVEVAPPPLNPLPPRIDLRFQVSYGLASGEQTMVWVNLSLIHI